MDFLKEKNQAGKMVKNYLTCLITSGRKPKYICNNHGKEFLSDQLKEWCDKRGIKIQLTTQNGVVEHMNCTLIELTHAMITANELCEYLWESTAAHATYLQNQAFTITLNTMPYQIWHRNKPNVAHLREFSTPIWILLQGKYIQQRIFVSYNDGSHSVEYYNIETKTILTSHNFCFLQPSQTNPPEHLIIQPNQVEGESMDTPDASMPEMSDRNVSKELITLQDEEKDLPIMK